MPFLARLYIKTALAYLAVALLVGGALTLHAVGVRVPGAGWWPVYVHLFTVGWLTQLIFGVAFWLFPRHSRERPYGTVWPVGAAYGCLNAGLLLRAVAEPGLVAAAWTLPASAVLQGVGGLLLAAYFWGRVKVK